MALELIVSAGYQKRGSILRISLTGTYGLQRSLRPTFGCYVSITLARLRGYEDGKSLYLLDTMEFEKKVIISRDGSIVLPIQNGLPEDNHVLIEKQISNTVFRKAHVVVDVYKNKKLLASQFVWVS